MIGYFENSSTGNKTTTTMRIWRRSFPRSWLRCSNIQEFNRAVIAYTAAAGGGDDAMPGCCWHDRTGTAMRQQAPGPRRLFLAPYRTLARAGSVSRRRRSRLSARMRQRRADCRHATRDACLHEPACRMACCHSRRRAGRSRDPTSRRVPLCPRASRTVSAWLWLGSDPVHTRKPGGEICLAVTAPGGRRREGPPHHPVLLRGPLPSFDEQSTHGRISRGFRLFSRSWQGPHRLIIPILSALASHDADGDGDGDACAGCGTAGGLDQWSRCPLGGKSSTAKQKPRWGPTQTLPAGKC